MTIEERLEKVEKGYRRLKVACGVGLLALGSVVGMGLASPREEQGGDVAATVARLEAFRSDLKQRLAKRELAGQSATSVSPNFTADDTFYADYFALSGGRGSFGFVPDPSGGFVGLLMSDPDSDASIFLDVSISAHTAAILVRDYRGKVKFFKHTKAPY